MRVREEERATHLASFHGHACIYVLLYLPAVLKADWRGVIGNPCFTVPQNKRAATGLTKRLPPGSWLSSSIVVPSEHKGWEDSRHSYLFPSSYCAGTPFIAGNPRAIAVYDGPVCGETRRVEKGSHESCETPKQ